ncbi:MAG TPA: ABC transporter permease subunit [Acidimicrobiales bacterium]|nr:ABC transporter permease subunit [Acidimicrobiales bacterium]
MLPSVIVRAARDQRRSILVWTAALVALVAMYAAVYPSLKGNATYSKLIDEMPKAYRALFSVASGADFTTGAGYLNTELMSFMGPLLVLLYAVGAGSGAVAGEEDRHTMDMVLANPIGRGSLVVGRYMVLAGGVIALMAVLWAALLTAGAAAGMGLPVGRSAAAVGHLGALGMLFGALAMLTGAATGRLGLSRAVAAFGAVAAYLLNGFGQLVGWIRPLRPLSPFYLYNGHDPLRTGFWMPGILVSLALTALMVTAAVWAFRRRDVVA